MLKELVLMMMMMMMKKKTNQCCDDGDDDDDVARIVQYSMVLYCIGLMMLFVKILWFCCGVDAEESVLC